MTIYVPRAFGGTLALNITPPVLPESNLVLRARNGNAVLHARNV